MTDEELKDLVASLAITQNKTDIQLIELIEQQKKTDIQLTELIKQHKKTEEGLVKLQKNPLIVTDFGDTKLLR